VGQDAAFEIASELLFHVSRHTDAHFNIGFALAALQTLPHGVYLAMNGRVFDPEKTWEDPGGGQLRGRGGARADR